MLNQFKIDWLALLTPILSVVLTLSPAASLLCHLASWSPQRHFKRQSSVLVLFLLFCQHPLRHSPFMHSRGSWKAKSDLEFQFCLQFYWSWSRLALGGDMGSSLSAQCHPGTSYLWGVPCMEERGDEVRDRLQEPHPFISTLLFSLMTALRERAPCTMGRGCSQGSQGGRPWEQTLILLSVSILKGLLISYDHILKGTIYNSDLRKGLLMSRMMSLIGNVISKTTFLSSSSPFSLSLFSVSRFLCQAQQILFLLGILRKT